MSVTRIRVKERDAIIQSLKSGVTPRIGIQHIRVGCVNEITASIRILNGLLMAGQASDLSLVSTVPGKHSFKCCTVYCVRRSWSRSVQTFLPDRRIHSSGGQARNLYSELMKICPPETNQMAMHYLALWKGLLLRQGRKLMRTAPRSHPLFINALLLCQIWWEDMTLRRSLTHSGAGMSRITKP